MRARHSTITLFGSGSGTTGGNASLRIHTTSIGIKVPASNAKHICSILV